MLAFLQKRFCYYGSTLYSDDAPMNNDDVNVLSFAVIFFTVKQRWYFQALRDPRNRFQGIDSVSLCKPIKDTRNRFPAWWVKYDNPI